MLAVLQIIGAVIWLLAAIAMIATAVGSTGESVPGMVVAGLLLGALGAAQLLCGVGLLKLKPYGRTLQLVFAWIGLIGIPIGTIISILILVYMFKPGIKALFSGKESSALSADELTQIASVAQGSAASTIAIALGVVVLGVMMVGIVAAIAVPGLLRARMSGNEASAIGSLRTIISSQAAYASSCAGSFYAVDLADLAKPPSGGNQGFISPDLNSNGVIKSGYIVTLARDAAPGVTDADRTITTCNGSTATPASSYVASATPVTPGSTGSRYFATDASGTIYQSSTPIVNPIVVSPTVVPIQ